MGMAGAAMRNYPIVGTVADRRVIRGRFSCLTIGSRFEACQIKVVLLPNEGRRRRPLYNAEQRRRIDRGHCGVIHDAPDVRRCLGCHAQGVGFGFAVD